MQTCACARARVSLPLFSHPCEMSRNMRLCNLCISGPTKRLRDTELESSTQHFIRNLELFPTCTYCMNRCIQLNIKQCAFYIYVVWASAVEVVMTRMYYILVLITLIYH